MTEESYSTEQILSAWSVTWVLRVGQQITVKNHTSIKVRTPEKTDCVGEQAWCKLDAQMTNPPYQSRQRSFILYRNETYRLINSEKPASEALIIELAALMGFRSQEIATWKAEHVHFDVGKCEVYDVKKKRLFTLTMHTLVRKHAQEVLGSRTMGYVLRNRSNACKGTDKPLSDVAIWFTIRKHAEKLKLYPSPEDYSPVVLRRFFAAEWVYGQGLPLVTLSKIMRHSDVGVTSRYVEGLIFDEDLDRDYRRFDLNSRRRLGEVAV